MLGWVAIAAAFDVRSGNQTAVPDVAANLVIGTSDVVVTAIVVTGADCHSFSGVEIGMRVIFKIGNLFGVTGIPDVHGLPGIG